MNKTTFTPTKVEFEQEKCAVCWEEYKTGEDIVELACKHIYHPGCLPAAIVGCPTCYRPIAGRNHTGSSVYDIEEAVCSLFQTLERAVPSLKEFNNPNTRNAVTSQILEQLPRREPTVMRSVDVIKMLQEMCNDLKPILDGNSQRCQELLRTHSIYLIEGLCSHLTSKPVDLTMKHTLKSITKVAKGLLDLVRYTYVLNSNLVDYTRDLMNKVLSNSRVVLLFQERERKFIDVARAHLKAMPNMDTRQQYLNSITEELRNLLSDFPEAQIDKID